MAEPNKDLVQFKRRHYWQYAVLIAAAAYLLVLDPMRLWLKYETAAVTVTSVRQLCAAFEVEKIVPLNVDECPLVEKQYAGQANIEIKPRTFVSFDYTSPADGKPYSTSVVRDKDDQGAPVAVGSRITVRLSTSEPLVVQAE